MWIVESFEQTLESDEHILRRLTVDLTYMNEKVQWNMEVKKIRQCFSNLHSLAAHLVERVACGTLKSGTFE
jgi:hypothetical protein